MSALFVRPLPFVEVAGGSSATLPLSNANVDQPGSVYRTTNTTSLFFIIDLGTGASYDTVALIGTNLASTNTVRVRTGSTSTGIGGADVTLSNAYTGNKDSIFTTKSIVQLGATRTERYMRIDLGGTYGSGVTYFEMQRLVVGKAIVTTGIDKDPEQSFDDSSMFFSGPGYTAVQEYPVLPTWKYRVSWIPEQQWNDEFTPFFARVGQNKAFLFVPDTTNPTKYQHQVCFGRMTSMAKGEHPNYDMWLFEATMTGLAL